MYIYIILRMWNALYVYHIGMRAILHVRITSTTILRCGSTHWKYLEFEQTSKCLSYLSSSNVVKNNPKAHLHHMKVVKCLICVWHWSESHLEWVYSLNHHYAVGCRVSLRRYAEFEVTTTNNLANLSSSDVVTTQPYAHPKVVNTSNVWLWSGSILNGTIL